jgi:tripartite-type tricarboxylate transporter receptor subunit TctC
VRQDSPYRTAGDLIRAGREKPGALSYGILGIGSIPHLAMVELSQAAHVSFNAIPFKGDADVIQQVHGGHTDFGAIVLASAASSGLRILGLFSNSRNPGVPDLPTLKEQGVDVAPASPGGVSAPAGLPDVAKSKLREACKAASENPAYLRVMKSVYQPTDFYADAETYTKTLEKESTDKGRLLGELGMLK